MSERVPGAFFVILAAGVGSRFGGHKQLEMIGGKSVLEWTHQKILDVEEIGFRRESILIVTSPDLQRSAIMQQLAAESITKILEGGATRVTSIQRGILECNKRAQPADVMVFLDANRPLTPEAVISRCVVAASAFGAACPVVPLVDGVSLVSEGRLKTGPDRQRFFGVQTPEAIRLDVFRNIPDHLREGDSWHGIAELCIRAGVDVATVEGSRWGRKLTFPEDIGILEALLHKGGFED